MSDSHSTPAPSDKMRALGRLAGRWRLSGDVQGTTTYRWMDGGHFLLQEIAIEHEDGHQVRALEVIGHERPFGGAPSADVKSRAYDQLGNTLDYVYELDGGTLTIWGGEKGSPAYFKGEFNAAGDVLSGAWVYPGGGGYESTMTRIS
jgi:hypothetical protein